MVTGTLWQVVFMSRAQSSLLFKTQNRKDFLSPITKQPLKVGEQDVTDKCNLKI